ncbi:hypothetical protein KBZ08_04695 [Cyanobium sp. Candia 9D4]|uniref:hypothetical protein n=1 Tax=Cyanobium sp. Candia 9D4 TaxID=2823707 RepID=UPI0020CE60BF|nr:hypothetical protein [Cyanobium sp. Candia 9D4]MCP9933207.1 hypothetical protein [Cyanobium sp. Candia 9D4]
MRDLLTAKETAGILRKRVNSLYKIVEAFDANADDEWELVEGEHFEYAGPPVPGDNGRRPRRFSEEGVEALARYIEATEKTGVLGWFRKRLFKETQKRKLLLVSRRITQEFIEAGGTLEIRGDLAFVSRKTTVGILQTNYKGLYNSWERLRTAGTEDGEEALEIGKDFMQSDERQVLISQRGIARVARDMRANSRITKTRQAWIEAVGEVVETCFKSEIRHLTDGVDRAKKRAKAAASHRCEITGESSKAYRKIDLDGHHLFDRHSRPDLADLPENILVLVPELHREFHIWKSGPCTPKDVLVFIETVRADLFDPVNSRHMKRLRTLTHRLQRFQSDQEVQKVRYHRQ